MRSLFGIGVNDEFNKIIEKPKIKIYPLNILTFIIEKNVFIFVLFMV